MLKQRSYWKLWREERFLTLFFGFLLAFLFSVGTAQGAKLEIITSLPDLAALVDEVGGDRVQVTALCKGHQDPHYLEPKPSYARLLRKADLFIYLGLEFEVAWLPPLLETARNPDLRPGSPGLWEAATAIKHVLEIPSGGVDRSQGDIHPFGNPHVLLDPRNALIIAEGIADRLTELDPDGGEAYREGLADFQTRLQGRIQQWQEQAAPLRGLSVVAYHKQWEYLADWLGLEILDYIENRPGVPSSPRHVRSLIKNMKDNDVGLVISATFVDVDAAKEVASRAGANQVVLPAGVGGVEAADSYTSFIEIIINRLLEATS